MIKNIVIGFLFILALVIVWFIHVALYGCIVEDDTLGTIFFSVFAALLDSAIILGLID